MSQRDNILQELKELESTLANANLQSTYQVPAGYFEGLASQVLKRVKALDAATAGEELSHLSPLLSGLSRQTPYAIPANYFEGLAESVIRSGEQTAVEELSSLSPLLSGLKKSMPYEVPAGYFEKLNGGIEPLTAEPVRVVWFTKQKWLRYAAAAAVVAFVVSICFVLFDNKNTIDPKTQPTEWVIKNTNKINPEAINNFVQLADEDSRDIASVNDGRNQVKDRDDVSELIKDIPDKDIQDFLEETRGDENINDEDVLMN